jgi:hypothetical protein
LQVGWRFFMPKRVRVVGRSAERLDFVLRPRTIAAANNKP